jgi:proline dehydrogenase
VSNTLNRLLFWGGFAAGAAVTYRNGEEWISNGLLYLQGAPWARSAVSSFPPAWAVASRFVAGESSTEAIAAARELNAQGMRVSMDFLGESVNNRLEAAAARNEILALLDKLAEAGVNSNVSVKLSQLGLNIDPKLARENMQHILERAQQYNNWVRIDMEDSPTTDVTLATFRQLRDEDGFTNSGVVIQSYLYRSEADIDRLIAEGARVRLCKGAYAEPPEVAYPAKKDTDASFVHLMQKLLSEEARRNGVVAGIATHDEKMIQATIDYVKAHNVPTDAFEFQMLFGVRRELQRHLIESGYNVRVYVPYGTAWYPYFMRRLAERPANLYFFLSNFFRN